MSKYIVNAAGVKIYSLSVRDNMGGNFPYSLPCWGKNCTFYFISILNVADSQIPMPQQTYLTYHI